MVQVIHVVGLMGAGKSSLIRILAEGLQAGGQRCIGVDECAPSGPRDEIVAAHPDADFIFLERLLDIEVDAQRGDWVLHCERKS